jgi:hypothetical protein
MAARVSGNDGGHPKPALSDSLQPAVSAAMSQVAPALSPPHGRGARVVRDGGRD